MEELLLLLLLRLLRLLLLWCVNMALRGIRNAICVYSQYSCGFDCSICVYFTVVFVCALSAVESGGVTKVRAVLQRAGLRL